MSERKCLYCGKTFTIKHPSQKFCGKRKKTGRHLCKDRYHNEKRFGCNEEYSPHPFSDDAFSGF